MSNSETNPISLSILFSNLTAVPLWAICDGKKVPINGVTRLEGCAIQIQLVGRSRPEGGEWCNYTLDEEDLLEYLNDEVATHFYPINDDGPPRPLSLEEGAKAKTFFVFVIWMDPVYGQCVTTKVEKE
jgi:hypothetical protein